MKKNNSIKLDWFSFIVKKENIYSKKEVEDLLSEYFPEIWGNGFEYNAFGRYLYNRSFIFQNIINIYFNIINNKTNEMYLYIEFTGQGLDFVYSIIGENLINYFQQKIMTIQEKYEVKVKRLDLAYDDFRRCPYLELKKINKHIEDGNYVSKSRTTAFLEKYQISNTKNKVKTGDTLYLGRKGSKVMLRLYDKKLEQLAKLGVCEHENWLRYELVLKDEKAQGAWCDIVDKDLVNTYFVYLNKFVRFVEQSTDSNKSRLPNAIFWDKFLHSQKKLVEFEPTKIKKQSSIEKLTDWMSLVSSPLILGKILAQKNGEVDSLTTVKLSDKQKKLIREFENLEKEKKEKIINDLNLIFL